MGRSKTDIFTDDQNLIATYAKALGHPARVAILQYLVNRNTCVCGDIVNEIGLAQATVSQHLKELKQIGLIQGNVDGTSVCYCINPERWEELKTVLGKFTAQALQKMNGCC